MRLDLRNLAAHPAAPGVVTAAGVLLLLAYLARRTSSPTASGAPHTAPPSALPDPAQFALPLPDPMSLPPAFNTDSGEGFAPGGGSSGGGGTGRTF